MRKIRRAVPLRSLKTLAEVNFRRGGDTRGVRTIAR